MARTWRVINGRPPKCQTASAAQPPTDPQDCEPEAFTSLYFPQTSDPVSPWLIDGGVCCGVPRVLCWPRGIQMLVDG